MEFTEKIIDEFWNKEFKCHELTLTRRSWTPDKYCTVARRPDHQLQIATNVIYDLLVGNKTEAVKYLCDKDSCLAGGWYFGGCASDEERAVKEHLKNFGFSENENTKMTFFFGSRDFKKVESYCIEIFGDMFFFYLFDVRESPLYEKPILPEDEEE